jgi:acyl-CoA synthetase (AMP-forming)/AMP-acid ligase II
MLIGDLSIQCARRYPNKTALVSEENRLTYREFNRRVNCLADSLMKLGLAAGDKVAVLSRNNIEMFEICFAAAKTGMVWVPVNFRLVPSELKFVLNDAEIGILFVGDTFKDQVEVIRNEITVPHIVDIGAPYEEMIRSGSPEEPAGNVNPDDLFAIFYTSGTTGGPKGVMLSHDNFLSAVVNHAIAYKLGPSDVSLHVQPCYHTMEASMVLCHFYVGGTNIMVTNFNGHEFWKLVEKERSPTSPLSTRASSTSSTRTRKEVTSSAPSRATPSADKQPRAHPEAGGGGARPRHHIRGVRPPRHLPCSPTSPKRIIPWRARA